MMAYKSRNRKKEYGWLHIAGYFIHLSWSGGQKNPAVA